MSRGKAKPSTKDPEEKTTVFKNKNQTTPFVAQSKVISKPKQATTTKENPIDISESPDKKSKDNDYLLKNKVVYDFINCKKSPFSYDLSHRWNTEKTGNILLLPMCSPEDSSFITQCLTQPNELRLAPILQGIIKKKDLVTLFTTNKWINDCVVDSLMKMLNYKHSIHKYKDKCHFHKVSLFEYITNDNLGKLAPVEINNSNNVATYPGKNNFFSYDKHIIPVNWKNKHWTTCIVDMVNCIVYNLDSMYNESTHQSICQSVMKYVEWEINSIKTSDDEMVNWKIEFPTHINRNNIPQQEGGFDCGIFSILFAEMVGYEQDIRINRKSLHIKIGIWWKIRCMWWRCLFYNKQSFIE